MRHILRTAPGRRPPTLALCEEVNRQGLYRMQDGLRTDGFSLVVASHALSAVDACGFGFVLTGSGCPPTPVAPPRTP